LPDATSSGQMRSAHVPAGERWMMIFLEVAIGALGLALLTTPIVIALADKRKLSRPK
jgi:hypothetical protein